MKTPISLRHVYFQIMLWSLGVAAAAGFIAMLVASYDVVGRVAATAFATAAASGILWRLEAMLDDADKSVYGLLGMVAATGICYLLSLFGIWAEEDQWRWWLTVCALGITAPAAMGCCQLIAKRRDFLAGLVGMVFSCVVLIVSISAIWFVQRENDPWFETVAALTGYGVLITLCLISLSRTVRDVWRWSGTASAAMACVLNLQTIWSASPFPEPTIRIITILVSVAIVVVHANLSFLVPLRQPQAWIRWGTIASAILTAGFVDAIVVFELQGDTLAARLAGATAIVAGCGSLALVILARYNRFLVSPFTARPGEIDPTKIETMTVVCPCCGSRQTIALGEAQCRKCSLEIHIRVQAARSMPGE